MDLQALVLKPGDLIKNLAGPLVDQQSAAQGGIGGMDRDKQRREALSLDPLPIGWQQVGEGEVGAVEKAEAVVVVFEIQA